LIGLVRHTMDSDIARQRHQKQQRRFANLCRNNGRRTTATDDSSEQRPSLFSEFAAKTEWKGTVLIKYRVDSAVTSVFNHRITFMEAKMMELMASILKIDFNFKLASKIRVLTKQGRSFSPCKCLVTVQKMDLLFLLEGAGAE
jgi:hypothetical protein